MTDSLPPSKPAPVKESRGCFWFLMLFVHSVTLLLLAVVAMMVSGLGASLVHKFLPDALWVTNVICIVVGLAIGGVSGVAGTSFAALICADPGSRTIHNGRRLVSLLVVVGTPIFRPDVITVGSIIGAIIGGVAHLAPGWEGTFGAGSAIAAFVYGIFEFAGGYDQSQQS